MTEKTDHKKALLESLSLTIEKAGQDDPDYDNFDKARDILDTLESLLAYAIYNTCVSPETIRDSAEESYVNIKRRALAIWNNNEGAEKKAS